MDADARPGPLARTARSARAGCVTGTVDTAFQREPGNRAYWEQWVGSIPLGRIGEPAEIGDVVAFLASDAASFIVGETIHINGGIYMS